MGIGAASAAPANCLVLCTEGLGADDTLLVVFEFGKIGEVGFECRIPGVEELEEVLSRRDLPGRNLSKILCPPLG
jgi:hypothetical protein